MQRTLKKFIFYADMHEFGPKDLNQIIRDEGEFCFILGDTVDPKNAIKKYVPRSLDRIAELIEKFKGRYILGNHECMKDELGYYRKKSNILLCHGHTLFYSVKKVLKWENRKKLGIKAWRWHGWRGVLKVKSLRRGTFKPSQKFEMKCAEIMDEWGCDTIVLGHTHTKKLVIHTYVVSGKQYTIVNIPRGRHEVHLPYAA